MCVTILEECFLVWLIFSPACANWVKVQSITQEDPKLAKGEEASDLEELSCMPDIHSWTAETWGSRINSSQRNEDNDEDAGMPKSTEGKIIVLQSVHDRLVNQIYNQVAQIDNREARGMKGGMGSSEGALITISLLTFAVYLIKLVIKLVDTVHEKKGHKSSSHQMMNPTPLPANLQTVVLSHHGRRRRKRFTSSLVAAMEDLDSF